MLLDLLACTTCDPSLQARIFNAEFLSMLGRILAPALAAGVIAAALHRLD